MRIVPLAIAATLAATGSVGARDLTVPADKGWQHAATGLVLRPTLLGLPRMALIDNTAGEWDVAAQFNDPALATSATVYLFHASTPNAAVWFDRAAYALEHRPSYGGADAAGPAIAFALPEQVVTAGLRRSYVPRKGPYKSAAVAVMPVGDWLVAVRLSSTEVDPTGLDARLTMLLAEIGWPKALATPAAAATPVAACATRLAFAKAKQKKPDMGGMLLGSVLGGSIVAINAPPEPAVAVPWCREGEATGQYGVYRHGGRSDGYLLALGDAGTAARVAPAVSLSGSPAGYAVSVSSVDGSFATYPSFDALPKPEQVMKLILSTAPLARTVPNGKQVTVNVNVNGAALK